MEFNQLPPINLSPVVKPLPLAILVQTRQGENSMMTLFAGHDFANYFVCAVKVHLSTIISLMSVVFVWTIFTVVRQT